MGSSVQAYVDLAAEFGYVPVGIRDGDIFLAPASLGLPSVHAQISSGKKWFMTKNKRKAMAPEQASAMVDYAVWSSSIRAKSTAAVATALARAAAARQLSTLASAKVGGEQLKCFQQLQPGWQHRSQEKERGSLLDPALARPPANSLTH